MSKETRRVDGGSGVCVDRHSSRWSPKSSPETSSLLIGNNPCWSDPLLKALNLTVSPRIFGPFPDPTRGRVVKEGREGWNLGQFRQRRVSPRPGLLPPFSPSESWSSLSRTDRPRSTPSLPEMEQARYCNKKNPTTNCPDGYDGKKSLGKARSRATKRRPLVPFLRHRTGTPVGQNDESRRTRPGGDTLVNEDLPDSVPRVEVRGRRTTSIMDRDVLDSVCHPPFFSSDGGQKVLGVEGTIPSITHELRSLSDRPLSVSVFLPRQSLPKEIHCGTGPLSTCKILPPYHTRFYVNFHSYSHRDLSPHFSLQSNLFILSK